MCVRERERERDRETERFKIRDILTKRPGVGEMKPLSEKQFSTV